MTSRRAFLQAAAMLSAVPLSIRAGIAADVSPGLSALIIDERYAAARSFGTHAERAGISLRRINGDITDLWLTELRPRWASRPAPIAGLTARPALFCLEQLAWDHRLRVVHHVEHRLRADGTAEHTAAGADWPAHAAAAISPLPRARSRRGPSSACMEAAVGDDEITLHSWVIA